MDGALRHAGRSHQLRQRSAGTCRGTDLTQNQAGSADGPGPGDRSGIVTCQLSAGWLGQKVLLFIRGTSGSQGGLYRNLPSDGSFGGGMTRHRHAVVGASISIGGAFRTKIKWAVELMERRAPMSRKGGASIGSPLAPTTSSLPSMPKPGIAELMVFASVTVDKITLAPPSLVNSSAAFCLVLSI